MEDRKVAWCTLAGPIDSGMTSRVFAAFSAAVNNRIETVHMLIQSDGGMIGEGISIYNFLRHLPLRLITYNAGSVASIAVTIFIAGEQRHCSDTATFMIHMPHNTMAAGSTADQYRAVARNLDVDGNRLAAIYRERTNITDSSDLLRGDERALHGLGQIILTAEEAISHGVVSEIKHFTPPAGGPLVNI